MGQKKQITKGVLKGKIGKIVATNDKDRYGKSHTLQTDDGEIITPVRPDEMKDV